MKKKLIFDCIIIGAGPAGLTASIYLKRAKMNVLIIEKEMPGGQMNYAPLVKNYPGFDGIEGTELALKMLQQTQNLDIEVKISEVVEVQNQKEYKVVRIRDEELFARFIIIATGRSRKRLKIKNEDELLGHGVSYCALCDANFFVDREVAVIGGGNSAAEEALHLAKVASRVTLLHHNETFRTEKEVLDEVINNRKITILTNVKVTELVKKEGHLEALKMINVKTKEESYLLVDGVFVAIGSEPNSDIFRKLKIKQDDGYIVVDNKNKTNVEGIYAVGDAVKKDVYQIVTATSDGAVAANDIIKQK